MALARTAYVALAWLFVLGVVIQFLLAGLGVMADEGMGAHAGLGDALTVVTVVLFLLAFVGRMGRVIIGGSAVLFLLVLLQSLWADDDLDPEALRSLHVLAALAIFAVGHYLAQTATRQRRREAA